MRHIFDGQSIHRAIIAFCIRILVPLFLAVLVSGTASAESMEDASDRAFAAWKQFRTIVPDHLQDWVLAGKGPRYTLIYSEPPPAYDLNTYMAVMTRAFRGLKAVSVQSRQLGYNGRVSDLVLELDYGFAGPYARDAVLQDLAALSQAIYGTTNGARAVSLDDLVKSPPRKSAPRSLSVSAEQLGNWLYSAKPVLEFASPESGIHMPLSQLASERGPGRYLSIDNNLVLWVIRTDKELGQSDISNARLFALDSDLILGGVVDSNANVAIVAGRARQLSWIDFPPLRVEDMLNLVVTRDDDLAQSYDRTFPGAGRIVDRDKVPKDWAPSYLSADLIDTDFGSLLNKGDAILKSQSLADAIEYVGYPMAAIPNPPYPEGVFQRISNQRPIDSLIFNFNTVGAGHWFADAQGRRIFAVNRTGSFSVTYSPGATGDLSTDDSFVAVSDAEQRYTTWFDASSSKVLARTVQYMSLYQIFKDLNISGIDLYGNRKPIFDAKGKALQTAVSKELDSCIGKTGESDENLISEISTDYQRLGVVLGLDSGDLRVPASRQELLDRAAAASTAIRYDGNLQGSTSENTDRRINELDRQRKLLKGALEKDAQAADAKWNYIATTYKEYEILSDVSHLRYEFPQNSQIGIRFEQDKADYIALANKASSEGSALTNVETSLDDAVSDRSRIYAAQFGDQLLLDALNAHCSSSIPDFQQNVMKSALGIALPNEPRSPFYSIVTPTIVVSRNRADETGIGGHNVGRHAIEVAIDPTLPSGQFAFTVDGLKISAADSSRMSEITAKMSRVADADPATQAKVFAEVIGKPEESAGSIHDVLGIPETTPATSNLPRDASGLRVDTTPPPIQNTGQPSYSMQIGRGQDGRLFVQTPGDGSSVRAKVFGAYDMPAIIQNRLGSGQSATVYLDSSLSAREVDAIIANYKHADPTGSGGGGWIGGPPKSTTSAGEPQGPRSQPLLLTFVDANTGAKRRIFQTRRGRVEIEVSKDINAEALIEVLETEIAADAALVLQGTKARVNGKGNVFLVTDFEIQQSKAIDGTIALVSREPVGQPEKGIIGRLREIIVNAFSSTKQDAAKPSAVGDFVVEVQKSSREGIPGYDVRARLNTTGGRLEFVLVPRASDQEGG